MAPAKKKARKGNFDLFRSTLQEYHDGRQSVQEIVKLCRAYQGPNCHLLWDGRGKRVSTKHLNKCYIDACFSLLSEEKMIDLIRAMIAEDPGFLRGQDRKADRLLDPNGGNTSFNVLRLLAVREVMRIETGYDFDTPLLLASQIQGLDPAVLHLLIDLDPEALQVQEVMSYRPLHYALAAWTPATDTVVSRMAELSPFPLVDPCWYGPVTFAMKSQGDSPQLSRRLRGLIEQHPQIASPGTVAPYGTTLLVACHRSAHDRGLIEAVLRTYPSALCFACAYWHDESLLPYEAAARYDGVDRTTVRYLKEETLHMVLAAVEYAIDSFDHTVDEVHDAAVSRDVDAAEEDHSDTDVDRDEATGLDDYDADDNRDSSMGDESDSTYTDVDSQDMDDGEDWFEYDDDTADLDDNDGYDDMHPYNGLDSANIVADSQYVDAAEETHHEKDDDDAADLKETDAYDERDTCVVNNIDSAYTVADSHQVDTAKYDHSDNDNYAADLQNKFTDHRRNRYMDFGDRRPYVYDYCVDRYPYMDREIDYYTGSALGVFSDDEGYSSEDVDSPRQDEAVVCNPVDEFRRRVLSTVSGAARPADLPPLRRASGYAWTQALLKIDNCLELCRELFVCPATSRTLEHDKAFREAVLRDTVLNLYRMNQMGRRSDPSPHHQVRLLALVRDNLESVYLQFREFGASYLVVGNAGSSTPRA